MRRGLLALCRFAHIYIHRLRADIDTDSLSLSLYLLYGGSQLMQRTSCEIDVSSRVSTIKEEKEEGAGKRKRAADIDQITAAGKGKTFFIFVISFHAPGSGKRQNKTKQKKRRRIKGKYPSCWLYVTASVLGTTVPACHFVRAFLPLYVSCCRCFLVDIFCLFFLFSFR